jgi:hypothetical protein
MSDQRTEVVLQEKQDGPTISKKPVILAGCPVFLNSLQATLKEKMDLYFKRNMVVIDSDHPAAKKDYSNKKVIYLVSEVDHCKKCFFNGHSVNDVNEHLTVELDKIDDSCTKIMLVVSANHPFIRP